MKQQTITGLKAGLFLGGIGGNTSPPKKCQKSICESKIPQGREQSRGDLIILIMKDWTAILNVFSIEWGQRDQPSLKRKPKTFPKGVFTKSSVWQEIPPLHTPAIGSPTCTGVGSGAAHLAPWAQRMPAVHHVFPRSSPLNILVWSQPRSLGCYTTGLLNENSTKIPGDPLCLQQLSPLFHISSHSLLTFFGSGSLSWISAGFMTKRWYQFMVEKACFAPSYCWPKCSFGFLKPERAFWPSQKMTIRFGFCFFFPVLIKSSVTYFGRE